MSDSDLMFRSAGELAAHGAHAARSPRASSSQISLERIEELNPALNAFVEVDAERRARGRRRRSAQATSGRSPACRSRSRTTAPVEGLRLTYGCELMAEYVAPYDHNVTRRLRAGGLRDRRHDDAARVRHPAGQRGAHLRPDAQSVGPGAHARWLLRRRRRRGRGRDGPGRARQRRRRLDADPGRLLRARRPEASARAHLGGARARRLLARDRRRAHPHRRRHGRDPRRARGLRARRRHLGAAAGGAVRAQRRRASPASCGSPPRRCRRSPARASIRSARGAVADAAELLRSLGHEVEEVDPPWQDEGLSELFGAVFSSHIALSIAYSGRVAGREPTAEDMEPMSWAIYSMVAEARRDRVHGRGRRSCRPFARKLRLLPRALRRAADAGAGRAAAAARDARHRRARSDGDVHALRAVHAVHAGLQRQRSARRSRCRCSTARTGSRSPCRSSGDPPARRNCSRSRRSSRRRSRGRSAGPAFGQALAG